ncbi:MULTISPECIES: nucleotide exchange factor GrpE [Qipengyuania]|uniref:Protein GrpE n=2 Tax=Qipengyuania TaxID=1855416 RepID=A0A6I4TKY3_9SPHN|nr:MULTISPECIES: nucleotide exchange factor GrpE [Qipengyuania]MXO95747.1 nucleotide exchange factor GrpE [Qipengyuania aquimaris]SFP41715.1 molecular chaperone GrpE [Qipengyuania nanhaisediminis]
MSNENTNEPQDKAVDEEVAREMEGVPEHLRDKGGEEDAAEEALDEALASLRGDLEAAKQDALYARAETQNVRRRMEKDVQDARNYAATGFARDILSVADNLARALDAIPAEQREDEKLKGFIAGIEATQRELEKVFNQNGITRIAAKGMPLDPNQHQAMMEIPTDEVDAGTIVQEMQAGYMIKDRLLRPAMVGVAKKPD